VSGAGHQPALRWLPVRAWTGDFRHGHGVAPGGEVLLYAQLGMPLPEGVGLDKDGKPTRNARETVRGGVLPFGGHKGYGLSFAVQAMGLLAGAALARGEVQDYGFLFIAFDPGLLIPADQFTRQVSELIDRLKATPRQPGVEEIRIPSERAFRERERRRVEGIVSARKVDASTGASRRLASGCRTW
jgi:LDH2 family malate/lactate/ureidoglycolate dehydrogenase